VTRNHQEDEEVWKQTSRQLEAVVSVTKAFIQFEFFKMLQEVLNTITNMIRGEYGAILLVHSGEVELVAHSGDPPEALVKTVLRQRVSTESHKGNGSDESVGLAAQTVIQKKTIVLDQINNLSISEAAFKVVKDIGITNLLSTPIVYHGQVLGVIQLARINNQEFLSQEIEIIESFGRELGLVITEKAAREIAEEARQDLEFFVDLLTHDISSQAMIVYSCLEEIKEVVGQEDEDSQFFVQSALQSLQRVQTIIDQVRLLSMIKELGTSELAPINVYNCIERSIHVIKSMFPDERIEIDITREECPIFVQGTSILDNCMINLLQNAVLADKSPKKKINIIINLDEENQSCKIEVIDRGEGIPDEFKDKIFLRFFRARSRSKGSGLGLYITRSILEKLNGSIILRDRIEGDFTKGSRFIVILPLLLKDNF
jgi:signal transduction histidine kinase